MLYAFSFQLCYPTYSLAFGVKRGRVVGLLYVQSCTPRNLEIESRRQKVFAAFSFSCKAVLYCNFSCCEYFSLSSTHQPCRHKGHQKPHGVYFPQCMRVWQAYSCSRVSISTSTKSTKMRIVTGVTTRVSPGYSSATTPNVHLKHGEAGR